MAGCAAPRSAASPRRRPSRIRRSISTTAGRNAGTRSTASWPLLARPTCGQRILDRERSQEHRRDSRRCSCLTGSGSVRIPRMNNAAPRRALAHRHGAYGRRPSDACLRRPSHHRGSLKTRNHPLAQTLRRPRTLPMPPSSTACLTSIGASEPLTGSSSSQPREPTLRRGPSFLTQPDRETSSAPAASLRRRSGLLTLRLEALHAPSQFTQGEPGGSRRGRRVSRTEPGRSPYQLRHGAAARRLPKVVGAANEQRAHLVDGGDAAVSRRATRRPAVATRRQSSSIAGRGRASGR